MRLFVFLGNIGKEYEKTRHNAGFLLANFLQEKWNFGAWKEEKNFFGRISEGFFKNEKTIFLLPSTYMNLSGKAVLALQHFYKIPQEKICVFFDDKDLFFGETRFREKGSSGGHNGIKDIIRVLGSENFSRIKMGVDNEERKKFASTADFVLSSFSQEEQKILHEEIFPRTEKLLIDGNF